MIPHTRPPLIEGPSTPTVTAVPNSIAKRDIRPRMKEHQEESDRQHLWQEYEWFIEDLANRTSKATIIEFVPSVGLTHLSRKLASSTSAF